MRVHGDGGGEVCEPPRGHRSRDWAHAQGCVWAVGNAAAAGDGDGRRVKRCTLSESGLVIPREQGLRYDAGYSVPVLMS